MPLIFPRLRGLHLPAAPLIGWFIALLEGVGGLMLAAGFVTRHVAPMVTVQMLVISYLLAPIFRGSTAVSNTRWCWSSSPFSSPRGSGPGRGREF